MARTTRMEQHMPQGSVLLAAWVLIWVLLGALTAYALQGGTDDVDTPDANAVVRLSMGCTGTLIAADLVLTAGHCISHVPPRPDIPRFNANNWEFPGEWYDLVPPVEVVFGNDRAGVTADGQWAGPWQTLTIAGQKAGPIASGDRVSLQTSSGFFLVAEGGRGNFIGADRRWALEWETFTIWWLGGHGILLNGDPVALVANNGQYLVAEGGGGGVVNANRTMIREWETFTIRTSSPDGIVRHGDVITLQAHNGQDVTAQDGGGAGHFRATAFHYSVAGYADIVAFRLDQPVPPFIATPATVLTSQPGPRWLRPGAFWRMQRFQMVGWGDTGGLTARYRQVAEAHHGIIPCEAWGISPTRLCVEGVHGATVLSGDSGSPLFWNGPEGKFLIGVAQGTQSGGGRYEVTFVRGGRDSAGTPKPNIGIWLEELLGREDCTPVNHVQVKYIEGRWKLVDGEVSLMDFGENLVDAVRAYFVLRRYRITAACSVERRHPSMTYYLASGSAPEGSENGEDCVPFDPDRLEIQWVAGLWTLVERYALLAIEPEPEADYNKAHYALDIITRYGFTHRCFIGRPNPSMTYFRR